MELILILGAVLPAMLLAGFLWLMRRLVGLRAFQLCAVLGTVLSAILLVNEVTTPLPMGNKTVFAFLAMVAVGLMLATCLIAWIVSYSRKKI